jgi:hypothetical protein
MPLPEHIPPSKAATVASSSYLAALAPASDEPGHGREGMIMRWKRVIYAVIEEAFNRRRRELCKEFPL